MRRCKLNEHHTQMVNSTWLRSIIEGWKRNGRLKHYHFDHMCLTNELAALEFVEEVQRRTHVRKKALAGPPEAGA